jgi:hypothetical protein
VRDAGWWAPCEKRESKSSGGVPEEAKEKDDSSKTTCWETNKRLVVRHRAKWVEGTEMALVGRRLRR